MTDPDPTGIRELDVIRRFAWRVTIAATLAGGFIVWWVQAGG